MEEQSPPGYPDFKIEYRISESDLPLTENHLKHKENDTSGVSPFIAVKREDLERNQLKCSLNTKLSHRPGSLELVELGVLQIDPRVESLIKHGSINYPRVFSNQSETPVDPNNADIKNTSESVIILDKVPKPSENKTPPKAPPLPPVSKPSSLTKRFRDGREVVKMNGLTFHHYRPQDVSKSLKEKQEAREAQQAEFLKLEETAKAKKNIEQELLKVAKVQPTNNEVDKQSQKIIARLELLNGSILKAECKKRNLPCAGRKMNLIMNLLPYGEEILRERQKPFSICTKENNSIDNSKRPVPIYKLPNSNSYIVSNDYNKRVSENLAKPHIMRNSASASQFVQSCVPNSVPLCRVNMIPSQSAMDVVHATGNAPFCMITTNSPVTTSSSITPPTSIPQHNIASLPPSSPCPSVAPMPTQQVALQQTQSSQVTLAKVEQIIMRIRQLSNQISSGASNVKVASADCPQVQGSVPSVQSVLELQAEHARLVSLGRLMIIERLDILNANPASAQSDLHRTEIALLQSHLRRLSNGQLAQLTPTVPVQSVSSNNTQPLRYVPVIMQTGHPPVYTHHAQPQLPTGGHFQHSIVNEVVGQPQPQQTVPQQLMTNQNPQSPVHTMPPVTHAQQSIAFSSPVSNEPMHSHLSTIDDSNLLDFFVDLDKPTCQSMAEMSGNDLNGVVHPNQHPDSPLSVSHQNQQLSNSFNQHGSNLSSSGDANSIYHITSTTLPQQDTHQSEKNFFDSPGVLVEQNTYKHSSDPIQNFTPKDGLAVTPYGTVGMASVDEGFANCSSASTTTMGVSDILDDLFNKQTPCSATASNADPWPEFDLMDTSELLVAQPVTDH